MMFKFLFGFWAGSHLSGKSARQDRMMRREIQDAQDPEVQEYRDYQRRNGFGGELYYLFTGRYIDE